MKDQTASLKTSLDILPANSPVRETRQIWDKVLKHLRERYGQAVCESWLKSVEVSDHDQGTITLIVPTRFKRDWIITHYAEAILSIWQQMDNTIYSIDVLVASTKLKEVGPEAKNEESEVRKEHIHPPVTWSAILDPRYTFENFIIGKPNEFAYAAAFNVATSPKAALGSNPLFLCGGVGLGKTHLMHAIAWHIRRNQPERNVIYISAEKFMYQFITALRNKDILSFKEKFRAVDVLMIDDVQFIGGKDSTQEEFFHTFNALIDQNRQLVISADRSPSDLDGIEERIRSRLGWGLVADINPTTYELRLGILQSKAEQMEVQVPSEVLEFLAHKITSNIRELEGALNKVIAHSNLVGRAITLEGTQDILRNLLRAHEKTITIEEIQRKVAEHYNIKLIDMHSARRSRYIARPRQIAMYLTKKLTQYSLPEIGRRFGGKDHTTVIHAIKTIEMLIEKRKEIADDVALLSRMLQ